MTGKNQHVVRRDDQWAVRGEGNTRDTSLHNTQAEAERAARQIAINQKSEVLIHGKDGRIRDRDLRLKTDPVRVRETEFFYHSKGLIYAKRYSINARADRGQVARD